MATVTGTNGADTLVSTGDPNGDRFRGRGGNDTITGGAKDDRVEQNVTRDGSDRVNLGGGLDLVTVSADFRTNVRLTFTSSEVGNGSAFDGSATAPQDGGLAVRLQGEDGGVPFAALSRYDDEGIIFSAGDNVTFDVRDLITGAQRGETFEVVILGTQANNTQTTGGFPDRVYYMNGGFGSDRLFGGNKGDFLVGGQGDDRLDGGKGDDRFIGGAGTDLITGGAGNDTIVAFNVTSDGRERANLGTGSDVVNVAALSPTNVRLTFTSAEVGNNQTSDSGLLANQDGDLAVRLQAEDGGIAFGALSRFDDEGITFVGGAGVTFDVRDLVTGAQRGEAFEVVQLGTIVDDVLSATSARPYYLNAGQGNDTITGGGGNDFLVGGAGADRLFGGAGADSFIGGAGADVISGGAGADTIATFNADSDGPDQVNLGAGYDVVNVSRNVLGADVRLTFTSADVGDGASLDGGTLAGEDGGLAVRLQVEGAGTDTTTGAISRFDDEGVTFVAATGVQFDVRDLVSGTGRGEQFGVATLGTIGADTLTAISTRAHYINGGAGDDVISGGDGADFLVGGAGNDRISGGAAIDTLLGGAGADLLVGGEGDDVIVGGAGADYLSGQGGADTFRFDLVSDSGAGNLDTVGGFETGIDTFDLSALRLGAADVVVIETFATYTLVSVDQGGNGSNEFTVQVNGTVTATDYVF